MRQQFDAYLEKHVREMREKLVKDHRYVFPLEEFCLTDKEYGFAELVYSHMLMLHVNCQLNKEEPSYWKEIVIGGVGLAALIYSKDKISKIAGMAMSSGAATAAVVKGYKEELYRRAAIAFTNIVAAPEGISRLAISLSVILAYRFRDIIDRLENSAKGTELLANFISLHIVSFVMSNNTKFDSLNHLIALMLKHAVPPKGNNSYREWVFLSKTLKTSLGESVELETLLVESPGCDESGTVYYKEDAKDPFKYPFQRLQDHEEAIYYGFSVWLDVAHHWNSLLGTQKEIIKKHHPGKGVLVPLKFHIDILHHKNPVLKLRDRLKSANEVEHTEVRELLDKLKTYLVFMNILRLNQISNNNFYTDKLRSDLLSGQTSSIQLIVYLQEAIETGKNLHGFVINNFTRIIAQDKELASVLMSIRKLYESLEELLGSYQRLYIDCARHLESEMVVIDIPPILSGDDLGQGFIQPDLPIAGSERVVLPPSKFASFVETIAEVINPLNLNKSANKLLDFLGVKDESKRLTSKVAGTFVITCATVTVAYYLWPEGAEKAARVTKTSAAEPLFSVGATQVGKCVIGTLGTFLVLETTVNACTRAKFIEYERNKQKANERALLANLAHQHNTQSSEQSHYEIEKYYFDLMDELKKYQRECVGEDIKKKLAEDIEFFTSQSKDEAHLRSHVIPRLERKCKKLGLLNETTAREIKSQVVTAQQIQEKEANEGDQNATDDQRQDQKSEYNVKYSLVQTFMPPVQVSARSLMQQAIKTIRGNDRMAITFSNKEFFHQFRNSLTSEKLNNPGKMKAFKNFEDNNNRNSPNQHEIILTTEEYDFIEGKGAFEFLQSFNAKSARQTEMTNASTIAP